MLVVAFPEQLNGGWDVKRRTRIRGKRAELLGETVAQQRMHRFMNVEKSSLLDEVNTVT